jgi:hypothetical protein
MKVIMVAIWFALTCHVLHAQQQTKVSAFLQYHPNDSQTIKHRSREALVKMNINTGEVKLTLPLHAFGHNDSAFSNALVGIQDKMELFFTVDGNPFLLHASNKNDAVFEIPGMLHINQHYHHVKVRFSVFRKMEQPNKADFSYLISISYTFLPQHYELNGLKKLTTHPIKIAIYKQPYSFDHNTF